MNSILNNESKSPNRDQITTSVLVTGATGYLASHLIKLLLENDYKVRGTVRSLARKDKYEFLYSIAPEKTKNLELVEAELSNKRSWLSAVEGCEYVFHIASPFPNGSPKDENEIIIPAVEGTLNVLEAAVAKKVKRVVVTSSCLAIFFGNVGKVCTEDDWAKEEICPPYHKSKLKAEQAAWKFYEENKDKFEMVVVNPALILGPTHTNHGGASETLLAEIMKGIYPGVIDVVLTCVDVRDVAKGHYKAMFTEAPKGRRYACTGGPLKIEEIIKTLKGEFSKYGYDIKDNKLSAEEAKASGNVTIARHAPMIGKKFEVSNERSVKELGMTYTPFDKMIIDMAISLIKNGVVEDKTKSS